MVLLLTVSVPSLKIPPPKADTPLLIVTLERVTLAAVLTMLITVLMPPPSMIVFVAPEPISFKFTLMRRFSVYVAGAIMTESPDAASEMACPIVLQAVVADMQLLLSLPFTPSTYHVVLARAVGTRARNKASSERLRNASLFFMIFSLSSARRR